MFCAILLFLLRFVKITAYERSHFVYGSLELPSRQKKKERQSRFYMKMFEQYNITLLGDAAMRCDIDTWI